MGLMEKTAIIFTTDHGFYFGEHGGLFGKMASDKRPDGSLHTYGEPGSSWAYSPLYEELVHLRCSSTRRACLPAPTAA